MAVGTYRLWRYFACCGSMLFWLGAGLSTPLPPLGVVFSFSRASRWRHRFWAEGAGACSPTHPPSRTPTRAGQMNEEERGRICSYGNPMLSRMNGCPAYLLVFMQLVSSFQWLYSGIYIAEYAYVQLGGLEYNFRLSGTSRQLRRSANIQQMTLGDFSYTSQMKRGYVVKFVGFSCQCFLAIPTLISLLNM